MAEITAGRLGQRISIVARTETESHGSYTEAWAATHSRWPGAVRALDGRDLERARQIDPRIAYEVTLRYWRAYLDDLDGGRVRLTYHPTASSTDDRTLEIVTPPIDVDAAHRQVRVFCREVAA